MCWPKCSRKLSYQGLIIRHRGRRLRPGTFTPPCRWVGVAPGLELGRHLPPSTFPIVPDQQLPSLLTLPYHFEPSISFRQKGVVCFWHLQPKPSPSTPTISLHHFTCSTTNAVVRAFSDRQFPSILELGDTGGVLHTSCGISLDPGKLPLSEAEIICPLRGARLALNHEPRHEPQHLDHTLPSCPR